MVPFPRLIFNMLYCCCEVSHYPARQRVWPTAALGKSGSQASAAPASTPSAAPVFRALRWLKDAQGKVLLPQSSWSGPQERHPMAYGHRLYLQLCLMACLLPVSENSHSTCLFLLHSRLGHWFLLFYLLNRPQ